MKQSDIFQAQVWFRGFQMRKYLGIASVKASTKKQQLVMLFSLSDTFNLALRFIYFLHCVIFTHMVLQMHT